MQIARFEDIIAWQRARTLVSGIYDDMRRPPAKTDYGFRNQICRASVSVMTNIAEGFSHESRAEFRRYLGIARASSREVQSLLHVGLDIGYFTQQRFDELYDLVNVTAYLISRLARSLERLPATDAGQ